MFVPNKMIQVLDETIIEEKNERALNIDIMTHSHPLIH